MRKRLGSTVPSLQAWWARVGSRQGVLGAECCALVWSAAAPCALRASSALCTSLSGGISAILAWTTGLRVQWPQDLDQAGSMGWGGTLALGDSEGHREAMGT